MKTSLVVMAAGMGSRFGGGIKQLEPVGPNGEIIIDYSVYEAIRAGFDRVVFIIRHDIEEDFKKIIGSRIERICETAYVFQEKDDLPDGFKVSAERTKPWGTGQAVLSCLGTVQEPFAIINADDYYGREAFVKVHDELVKMASGESKANGSDKMQFCMPGFILKNTLSENGGVTRGICRVGDDGFVSEIEETKNICCDGEGAYIPDEVQGGKVRVDENMYVSMNMWGCMPEFLNHLQKGFAEFLKSVGDGDLKSEYLIPIIINDMIKKDIASVKLLETKDKWFGVTYKEDKQHVVDSFKQLIAQGFYNENLFGL